MLHSSAEPRFGWVKLAEVEVYVDIAIVYAILVSLSILAVAILLSEVLPG